MKADQNKPKQYEEIAILLENTENFLKENSTVNNHQLLNELYILLHKIDENSGIFGINSLSNLFSPIENALSNMVETGVYPNDEQLAVIISTISFSYSLLKDPSLNDASLKTNHKKLTEQVIKVFNAEKEDSKADFANNRFQEIFIEEANDLINQLEEKLLQLESEPDDPSLIDNVFRIMHTLKGNSNMFGFNHLGEVTHHLENLYDAIRAKKIEINREILDITLLCIDHFRNLIEDSELADAGNKALQENILNDIAQILEGDYSSRSTSDEPSLISGNELKTYYIYFEPQPNIFDDGSNPLYFVYDLNELGNCLAIPVLSELPVDESFNPTQNYTAWHILLATHHSKSEILENFIFLNETSQPQIIVVAKKDVFADETYMKSFKENAKEKKSIADKLFAKSVKPDRTAPIAAQKTTESAISSIRVASSKIDLMMNLISELVTKQAELSMIASDNEIGQLQEVAESIESISRDLRDNAFSISLIPLDKTVLRFQRLVRDVSTKFNKKVNFVVEGRETELDKTIIEKIVDPIMHILRNSIDHGIETPQKRREMGKPETGTISLKAYPSGAHVVIEISDDGSGISLEKVHKAAIKKGYISSNDDFTTDDMVKMILSPGFSTAENISEVSGRGVGMDVVNQKIAEIRGELNIETVANQGTTITIKLPLTISIIDSLLVMIGNTFYLIPLSVVQRCAEVLTPVITESKHNYLNLDGEYIPFIDLHNEFKIEEERLDYQRLIMVQHKDILVALIVDQIIGNHQAVLKSLGQAYRKQEIISGASILGNGEVALVLDTNKLVQEYMAERENEIEHLNRLNMKIKAADKVK